MPDKDGYPLEEELGKIKSWDIQKNGIEGLLDLIESCWWWADWGFVKTGKRKIKLTLHTAGWSGNEDIIAALREQNMFWMLYWVKTERGGHYYFEIPNYFEVPKSKQGAGGRGKSLPRKEAS